LVVTVTTYGIYGAVPYAAGPKAPVTKITFYSFL
jgi:hypothetical protein